MKNQRSSSNRKARYRLGIGVFTNIFATEIASLVYLKIFAILQDSCKCEVGTVTLDRDCSEGGLQNLIKLMAFEQGGIINHLL
jgi:hypothetical protein